MPLEKPNILLLFTDQQRYDTIAALGNPLIKTPVLDRLVREGTTFNQAYTPSPVCVAARCALTTGLPPHQTGCFDNMPMPQDKASFMDKLTAAGYQTHGVGKMHFTPDHTRLWGFQSRDLSEENHDDNDHFKDFLVAQGYGHVDDINGLRGEYYYLPQPSQMPAALTQTHWVADRSIDFLRQRDTSKPFFLWSSFIKPHPPFDTPTPWHKLYRSKEMELPFRPDDYSSLLNFWNRFQNRYKYMDAGTNDHLMRTMRAAYFACISFIDYNLGRILTALGDQIDNTLILFSSDHGELLGDYGSVGKRCMLDAAARIPLIARYPKQFKADFQSDTPVSLLDIYPTILKAAGIEEPPPAVISQSLDQCDDHPDRYVISQFSQKNLGLYMIKDRRYKYIYSAQDQKEWFFDANEDPRESRNLIEEQRPACQRLKETLIQYFEKEGYRDAVENGDWKAYPPKKFALDTDPNWCLLQQDLPSSQERINQLGPYARQTVEPDAIAYADYLETSTFDQD